MNQSKSSIAWLGYFIVGAVVLIVAAQLLSGILRFVAWIATVVLSILIVVAVGYVVYAFLKSAYKSGRQ
jgi:ATP/ADP translocase